MQDGWSDIHNTSVVATILLCDRHAYCTVVGVVTDSERKLECMRKNLIEEDSSLTVYGCSAHWLNLLGQNVTSSQTISQVIEINKYVRSHHVPSALLTVDQ